jgi:hypothetical protein
MLVELSHTPFHGDVGRVLVLAVHPEDLHYVLADHVLLPEAGQLEDALAGRDHPALSVANHEARGRSRVVVVEEFEEESEPAVSTTNCPVGQSFASIVVDGAAATVGADEVRHARDATQSLPARAKTRACAAGSQPVGAPQPTTRFRA